MDECGSIFKKKNSNAEWLGLRVSYELVLKLSCEAGESTSKLIHMAIGKP